MLTSDIYDQRPLSTRGALLSLTIVLRLRRSPKSRSGLRAS